jgi:hypothetical protein
MEKRTYSNCPSAGGCSRKGCPDWRWSKHEALFTLKRRVSLLGSLSNRIRIHSWGRRPSKL